MQTYHDGNRSVWNDFDPDPRIRHSFWSILIGGTIGIYGNLYCTSQSFVQRMLACKNQRNVRV